MKWHVGVKLTLLAVVYGICFYSFLQKFVFETNASLASTLQADYSACRPFDEAVKHCNNPAECATREKTLQDCRHEINKAFKEINIKCSSYLSKLNVCRKTDPMHCAVQKSNMEGCLNMILREHLQELISSTS